MDTLFVIDTCCFISYFNDIFNISDRLSPNSRFIITQAMVNHNSCYRLSIPSVVFVEIFEKWLGSEEFARLFYYEVYMQVRNSPNIEIKPLDDEVIKEVSKIRGNLEKHELHDKIILASAIALQCPLMTTDVEVIKYVEQNKSIPGIKN